MEKVNYRNEDIHIYFIRGKEAPKCIKEASKAVPVSDRRTSKRSRRTSSENLVSLKVSSSTSVYQLNLLGVCYRYFDYKIVASAVTNWYLFNSACLKGTGSFAFPSRSAACFLVSYYFYTPASLDDGKLFK